MPTRKIVTVLFSIVIIIVTAYGCDALSKCKGLCDTQKECNQKVDWPYSETECKYNCEVAIEKADYMDCMDEYEFYIDCLSELDCKDWDEQNDECGKEIEDYNECEQDFRD